MQPSVVVRVAKRVPAAAAALLLLGAGAVSAQNITGVLAFKNAGNNADEIMLGATTYERESAVAITASSATSFSTRYTALVSADSELFGVAKLEVLNSDYSIAFSVTAPGAYRLTVQQRRKGDLHLIEDNLFAADHYADMTALTGVQTGGTLTAGSLNLADPGRANDIPLYFDPIFVSFNQTATATLFGVSNGTTVGHTLTFTWSQEAYTPSAGDEAAVRLGGTSDVSTESAADYPGNPARTQDDDGHFVTVTLTSLCGNGAIDTGPSYAEQCDDGALNGTAGSCCNSNCTLRAAGTPCRPAAGECDVAELCTGTAGSCPANAFKPASTVCRAAAGVCDVQEFCSGSSASCPADVLVPDGTACSDGLFCNGAETCQGGTCTDGANPCTGQCDEISDGCFVGGCPPVPFACRTAEKSLLLIKNKDDDSRDRLIWKWTRGEATSRAEFGVPTGAAAYSLCLYAGTASALVANIEVPPSATKWEPLGEIGYKYRDLGASEDGAEKITLKGSAANRAKVLFKGRGAELPDPIDASGLSLPVTAQLLNHETGICWEGAYSTASPNSSEMFKAKQ